MMIIAVSFALMSGASIVISRMINAQFATHTSVHQSTFYNFLTGLGSATIALIICSCFATQPMITPIAVPWWAYGGGILGLLVVSISNVITPKLSAFLLTLLIFSGQIVTGFAIDYLMTQQLSYTSIAGTLLVILGLYIHLWLADK